ncbi:MAG: hypothetical protein AABY18_07135 [Candidatus Thermoplasmatota archaeon]
MPREAQDAPAYRRALVTFGVISALALLWLGMQWGGAGPTVVFTNLLHLGAPLVAAALAWRRANSEPAAAQERGWRWLALACWMWAVGQMAWMTHEFWFQRATPLVERILPFPYVSDIGFLAFFVAAIPGLLLLPRGLFQATSRIRLAQDAALVALSVALLAWVFFLRRIAADAVAEDPLSMVVLLAYPTLDVILVIVAALVSAYAVPEERGSLRLLMAGAAILAVGDAAFFLLAQSRLVYVSIADATWPAAFFCFGLAALHRGPAAAKLGWVRTGPFSATLAAAALVAGLRAFMARDDPLAISLATAVGLILAWRWVQSARETRRARMTASQVTQG